MTTKMTTTTTTKMNDKDKQKTYQRILPKNFLPPCRQLNRQHANLPPVVAAPHARPQRAAQDLVPKAHADDAHAVLLQHALRESDQLEDPRVVVEGIVFCGRAVSLLTWVRLRRVGLGTRAADEHCVDGVEGRVFLCGYAVVGA